MMMETLLEYVEASSNVLKPMGIFRPTHAFDWWSLICLLGWYEAIHLIWRWQFEVRRRPWNHASETLRSTGGLVLVGQLMSIFVSIRGTILCYIMLQINNPSFQYHGTNCNGYDDENDDLCSRIRLQIIYTGEPFMAYLFFDLMKQIMYYRNKTARNYGAVDSMLHHVAFLACAMICQHYDFLLLPFTWLIQGEWSTIFLNARWYQKELKASTMLADILFALSFFFTRIILYGGGLVHLLYSLYYSPSSNSSSALKHPTMPTWLQHLIVITLIALFGLNLIWFRSIVKIAIAKSSSKTKPKSK
jgi:hypothetical protein